MPIDLTIVIPAHNESSRIQSGFARLAPTLEALGPERVEVLVIDDGSSDDTGATAAATYGHLPHSLVVRQETNMGKGAAVRLGVTLARGTHVIACDADMAIHPSHIRDMIDALEDSPIAVGSRTVNGAITYDSRLRTWAGAAFNAVVRHYVATDLRDTQCGLKGLQLGPARLLACFGLVNGFAYDVELLHLAERAGLGVTAVPVRWDDVAGSSVHLLRDSRRMFHDIRGLARTNYECPVVRACAGSDLEEIARAARGARRAGLVVARGDDDLIVVPRDGALVALEVARAIDGQMGVADITEMRGRELFPV